MGAVVDYTKLSNEYIDRYTPEVARAEGVKKGLMQAFVMANSISKPTKQVKDLLAELEKKINE
jgi:hypothetical protein